MLIRCDKCTTLYELDDALLPPGGAPVQCSKCQYVFVARPPRPAAPEHANGAAATAAGLAGDAPPGAPTAEPAGETPAAGEGREARPPRAAAEPRPGAHGLVGATIDPNAKFTPDGRPIRKVAFPTEEPPQPGPKVAGLKPTKATPVRVRPAGKRHPWLVAVVVLALLAVAGGGVAWLLLARHARDARRRAPAAQAVPPAPAPAHAPTRAPAPAARPAPPPAPAPEPKLEPKAEPAPEPEATPEPRAEPKPPPKPASRPPRRAPPPEPPPAPAPEASPDEVQESPEAPSGGTETP